jgi:hypothetical protein
MTKTACRLLYPAIFVILVILLSSCTTTVLPSAKDFELINSGKRSIVLIRIKCEAEGESYEVFRHFVGDDDIGFALGGFETGGELHRKVPAHLSSQTRKDGWLYFVLEPGFHYLAIQPPRRTDVWSYENSFKNAPLWRLDIPPQTGIIYAGTLYLPIIKQKLLFGDSTIQSFITDGIVVLNNEDAARKIAADFFSQLETYKTVLMAKHEGPIILKFPQMAE